MKKPLGSLVDSDDSHSPDRVGMLRDRNAQTWLDRMFALTANRSSVRQEVIAGITTFAAMAYVLAVNPAILAETGMDRGALVAATALAGVMGSLLMGCIANYPIALAPGMGTNSYFAYIIVLGAGVPWQAALGLVFWNGVIFLLLSVTGFRKQIAQSLPRALQIGIQCGVGFFIALLGFEAAGLVVAHPATLVTHGNLFHPPTLLSFIGLLLMAVLFIRGVKGGIILTILILAVVGLLVSDGDGAITELPDAVVSLPRDLSLLFAQLDLFYPFRNPLETLPIIFTLLLLDLFDSIGTIIGVSRRARLLDADGKLPRMDRALCADALATVGGAVIGVSTTTSYVESAAGVEAGGRTGLTSVVVALCFSLALFLSPVIAVIPSVATAPALILVGILMASGLRDLDYHDSAGVISATLTTLSIPLTFSITYGIAIGLSSYVVLMITSGRWREVPALTYGIMLFFLLFFAIESAG